MRKEFLFFAVALVISGCGGNATAASTAATAKTYSATVLADHPVAYWRMDEATGGTMADASGNANNGRYVGTYTLGQPGALAGGAVAFDGQSGAASVMNSPSLQVNTVTIEMWIKKHSDTEYGVYVAKNVEPGGGAGSGWFELLNSHHNGQLEFRVTSDGAPAVLSKSVLALNTWYYVVATYDGAAAKLYVNGKLDGELKVTAVPKQTSDPLFIGRRTDGLFNDAAMADVAIYSVALSAGRISAHWQASGAH
ncbi:MAG: LamG domain-containing protein [Chloroflexi bacterium]|nr:MAG: LamG domain-containing protein [Chloroflexota bacterium]